MVNKLKRMPGIFLTGFMGSGKTTVAHALADHLGWDCIDLDSAIEAEQQSTIAQIFQTHGEAEFRRIETEAIRTLLSKIARGAPAVVALGGGAFVQPANYEMIEHQGVSVWLDCPLETIQLRIAGDGARPLARDSAAFRQLFEERRRAYSRADYRIEADVAVEQAVELILALPFWK
jgi:shikimate kinase